MGLESEMLLLAHRQMLHGDFGGTITWGQDTYAANLGPFDSQQVLNSDGGGLSYVTMGLVTVAREDLPPTFQGFKRNEIVTCKPKDKTRAERTCRVEKMVDCGALIEITVVDVKQGA